MIVDTSNLATSMDLCLSKTKVILPLPLPEREFILFIPLTLANIASNFDVASISTTRGELLRIEKLTDMRGNDLDGTNFTGNNGSNDIPAIVKLKNITIMVNDDMFLFLFNLESF